MKQYKKYAYLALICIAVEAMLELLVPMIMADLIDNGVANGDTHYIYVKGFEMALCALIALVLGIGSARFQALAGQGLGANIRKAEYEKLQSYSFSNIDHFRVSSLVTRLTSDVTNIQNSVSTGMRPFGRSPVMLIFASSIAFTINRTLALVFFVALPILAVLLIIIIMNVRPLYAKMQNAIDLVNRSIQENLTAVRVVKSYVRGEYEVDKFKDVNAKLKSESEKAFGIAVLNMPAMQFVMYGTIIAILFVGGHLINNGQLKIGELTSFLSYVLLILNSLMMMSNVFLMMTRSLASATRIVEVLDEKIDITDENSQDISVKHGEIEFDHVWFKYKNEAKEYVLSDVSFHIKPGQTVGIIGQTGSSKTTLVQLIPRLYDATKGTVRIDGVDVKNYPVKHLRDAIAVVLQKNTLFSGSLISNLRWGNENATKEEIDEAYAKASVAIDELELKNMLRDEADQMDCVLKINSGAGGTESQDWASMLMRMYLRYAETNGYKAVISNLQEGDEAGIKTCTIEISGDYAYGYLKGENGVHRLVRVSPYNAQGKRMTSFASVFVTPLVDDTIEVNINVANISWDTFRSSGAGGQNVNKVESGVRLRYQFKDPYTGEEEEILIENTETRDQPKNRENAMRQLRSILYDKELQHRMAEQAKVEAGKKKIEWGSQIRSYVFDDRRVKDHRTNFQTSDVNGVMDGKIDGFIKAYLMEFAGQED